MKTDKGELLGGETERK